MKKYLTIAKAEWLDALQNPGEVFIYIVLESIPVFIMGSLWIANKNNLSNLDVSPSQLVTYYFIVLMTSRVIDFYFDETAQVEIRDGTFSKHLLKPFSFPLYLISSNLGGKMFHFFSLYIPVLFLLAFTFKSQIILPSSYNTLFFVISLILAYFINFAISALTATAAFFGSNHYLLFMPIGCSYPRLAVICCHYIYIPTGSRVYLIFFHLNIFIIFQPPFLLTN